MRFWLRTALAGLSGFLFALTLVWPDWIEEVFGVDPDRHSGALEWGLVFALLVTTLAFAAAARAEWRARAA
jgi:hypothetical protein